MKTQPKFRVVLDIEANNLLEDATTIHCAVAKCIDTGRIKKFRPKDIPKLPEFLDKCKMLIMHNGISYDKPLMKKLLGYEYKGKLVDTLLMSQVLRIGLTKPKGGGKMGPHSVEAYGLRYGRYKPENEDWSVFTEHMLHRCEEDVEITHLIYKDLMENHFDSRWTKAIKMSHKFFELAAMMERHGWLFDKGQAQRLCRILEYLISRVDRYVLPQLPLRMKVKYKGAPLNKPFKKAGGYSKAAEDWVEKYGGDRYKLEDITGPFCRIEWEEFNLGSGDQVKDYLLRDGWIPEEWNHKKDASGREIKDEHGEPVRTSPKLSQKDEFEGVSSSIGKRLAKRVQMQHRLSYLEGLLKRLRPDNRIGCGISGFTKTYRVRHRGIVNTPGAKAYLGKRIRQLFHCPPDRVLVSVDASSCQVRMEGADAKDEDYAKMLLTEDTHQIVTDAVNRVMKKVGGSPITRDNGKGYNFAMKFGARDPKLGKMAGLSEKHGSMIRASINQEFGAQDALIQKLQKEWKRNAKPKRTRWGAIHYSDGYIEGLDGRPIFINAEYKALVYRLQSSETIFMQAAFCYWYELLRKNGLEHWRDYGFVAHYHDEYTAEVYNPTNAELVKELGEEAMALASKHFDLYIPQEGDGAIGSNWLQCH